MKRIIAILLFISLLLPSASVFSTGVYASGNSGTCGEDVTWSYDSASGKLSLTGTGAMTNYTGTVHAPWYGLRTGITSVELSYGIESIGEYAFDGLSAMTDISVPASITSAKQSAFYGCSSLNYTLSGAVKYLGCDDDPYVILVGVTSEMSSSMPIMEGTRVIMQWAFSDCFKLTELSIPDGVTYIGDGAFSGCTKVTSVSIPESVTYIGSSAFGRCSKIKEITLPLGITGIGNYLFSNCSALSAITIPSGVTYIGNDAFSNCTSLSSALIPLSVTAIGSDAFSGCSSLVDIYYEGSETDLYAVAMATAERDFFAQAGVHFKSVCGGDIVWDFDSAKGLLTVRGTGDMYDYDNVTSFAPWYDIKDSVTSVRIMTGITSIGAGAFSGMAGMTEVIIPNGISRIGADAFSGCSSLGTVNYEGVSSEWNEIDILSGNEPLFAAQRNYVLFGTCGDDIMWIYNVEDHSLVLSGTGEMFNYQSSTSFPWYGFRTSITSIVLSEGITSVDDGAFSGCSSLVSVSLPDSIDYLGSSVFSGCTSVDFNEYGNADYLGNADNPYLVLYYCDDMARTCTIHPDTKIIFNSAFCDHTRIKSLTIPDGVEVIESGAFSNCTGLTSMLIPASVRKIYGQIFSSCYGLGELTVDLGNTVYRSDGNCIIEIASGKLIIGCKNSVIPTDGTVTSIGNSAFFGCRDLTSLTIPDSVVEIGNSAFASCRGLGEVILPDSIGSIGAFAFENCIGIQSMTIPAGITLLSNGIFRGCTSLESVAIPVSVITIEKSAFEACSSLSTVYYGGTEAQFDRVSIDNAGGNNFPFLNAEFYFDYSNGGSFGDGFTWAYDVDSATLTVTGTGAMQDFDGALPWSGVASIAESIVISHGVTSVGAGAFAGCSSAAVLSLPLGVTSVGANAFAGCPSLADVFYGGVAEDWLAIDIEEGNEPLINAEKHYSDSGVCGDSLEWSFDVASGVLTISGTGDMYDFGASGAPWVGVSPFITKVVIKSGATSIGANAFSGCASLENVIIPSGLSSVGSGAFSGCEALTDIYFGADNYAWSAIAFAQDVPESLSGVTVHYNSLCGDSLVWSFDGQTGALTINGEGDMNDYASAPDVPWYAFREQITSVNLPADISSVGENAFAGCAGLTDVYYGGDQTEWNAVDVHNTQNGNAPLLDAVMHFTYTVTYDANGGTGAPPAQKKSDSETITLSSVEPTRSYRIRFNGNGADLEFADKYVSCAFSSWNTKADGKGVRYMPGASYSVNTSMTLYAQWSESAAGELPVPVHDVYTFAGWYTAAIGGNEVTAQTEITSDITLYAHWNFYLDPSEIYYFANSKESFGTTYDISEEDFKKLCDYVEILYGEGTNTANNTKNMLQSMLLREFGGSCYGMAVTTILDKYDQIDFNANFDPGAATMHDVSRPVDNPAVASAINYYHISQQISYVRRENNEYYRNTDSNWSEGLQSLIAASKRGNPLLFCYSHDSSAHAIVIKGYVPGTDGSHNLIAYDNRFPNRDIIVKIDRNYTSCVVKGSEVCKSIDFTEDLSAFDAVDIDGPENDYANYTVDPGAGQGGTVDPNDDYAEITINTPGRVTLINAEGESLTLENGEYYGSMEVEDEYFLIDDGESEEPLFIYTVPKSSSFKFIPEENELKFKILSSDIYAMSETIGAEYVQVVNDDGITAAGEDISYMLSLSVNNEMCDMVSVSGISEGEVKLTNAGGVVTATGIDTELGTVSVISNTTQVDVYRYLPGYGSLTIVAASDEAGDVNIMGSSWEDGVYDVNIGIPYDCLHTWSAGVVTAEPTYTEDGTKTYTCTKCEQERTKPIPKLISDVPGDADGDGILASKDARLLKQYLAGLISDDEINLANVDLNGDGDVTSKDVRELKQLLVS
ncbi:MAG: leucine-rich repeat protein [Clostridia bacterium]|nr:leucine-rich repeat protein [Clostridia bacterium]